MRNPNFQRRQNHRIGRPCHHLVLLIAWLAPAFSVVAESVIIHPAADTALYETAADNNLGASTSIVAGSNLSLFRSRVLIRFDLAGQIPSNAVIQSAALTVTVVTLPNGGGTPSTFDLRKTLVAWVEGTGSGLQGVAALPGETSWNNRVAPSTPWSTPGGAVGNEFSSTISATAFMSNVLASYMFASTPDTVSDVQGWLQNPAANFGWAIISESEGAPQSARRIASREDSGNSPALTLQYVLPTGPIIQNVAVTNGQFQFNFLAQAGQAYTVEYRNSLAAGLWQTLTNVNAAAVTTNATVSNALSTNSQRFYRITMGN